MNTAIFITARTASTRLPNKHLMEISGKKAIEIAIGRVKKSKLADIIVLCTTTNPEDDILCDIASKYDILYFRGSEKDKMERWLGAAKQFDIDMFVCADADDLFCDPELIDNAFNLFNETNCDFIKDNGDKFIVGAFSYALRVDALVRACKIKDTDDTEMMAGYFIDTGLFHVESLVNGPEQFMRPDIRMTLDYQEDFEFFKHIITTLGHNASLYDVVDYLNENPSVIKINQHLNQVFFDNQKASSVVRLKDE